MKSFLCDAERRYSIVRSPVTNALLLVRSTRMGGEPWDVRLWDLSGSERDALAKMLASGEEGDAMGLNDVELRAVMAWPEEAGPMGLPLNDR